MCNAYNHPPDCTCGWGGDGHLGVSYGGGGGWGGYTPADWRDDLRERGEGLSFPTTCRWCGAEVYVYTNEFGSFVVFDELGWPWPKHDCPLAPAYVKAEVERGDAGRLLTSDIGSLMRWRLRFTERQSQQIRVANVGRTLKALHLKAPYPLHDHLNFLLKKIGREDLVFPARCGDCRSSTLLLFTQGNESVMLDDVWTLELHRCIREAHLARLGTVMTGAQFRKMILGYQEKAVEIPDGVTVVEGLVLEIVGDMVKLSTREHGLIEFLSPARVNPMDYLSVELRGRTATRIHRFALLRGGTDAKKLPGWTKRFRIQKRELALRSDVT